MFGFQSCFKKGLLGWILEGFFEKLLDKS